MRQAAPRGLGMGVPTVAAARAPHSLPLRRRRGRKSPSRWDRHCPVVCGSVEAAQGATEQVSRYPRGAPHCSRSLVTVTNPRRLRLETEERGRPAHIPSCPATEASDTSDSRSFTAFAYPMG